MKRSTKYTLLAALLMLPLQGLAASDKPTTIPAGERTRYYAHAKVEDAEGVIAPWYRGLNGQCDFRVRIAAETLKRYPWATDPPSGSPAPHWVYNGRWSIADDGTITPGELREWGNGDLPQRVAFGVFGLLDYYRYSGDPAAIAQAHLAIEVLLRHGQTPADHPWPRFLISVPTKGQPYGNADPKGMIALDLVGLAGLAVLRGHQVTGNPEWLAAASHWGDLLAANAQYDDPRYPPWNRYANPEQCFWSDQQTGSVILVLRFLDELIRLGHKPNDSLIKARDAGRAYVRNVLLPRWVENDTWARDYWDWVHDVMGETTAEMGPRYWMAWPEAFPNWRNDARNVFSLFLLQSCVSTESYGDVFNGAWAYPESVQCCDRSLSYPPMQVGAAMAEYAVRTGDEWAREMARRQFILATYDARETGVVEDDIQGGVEVAGGWLQVSHPLPLDYVLDGIGYLPEELGANRENHLAFSTSVISRIEYGDGRIRYRAFDAPPGSMDVLRLSFTPERVTSDGKALAKSAGELSANGWAARPLPNGDCIVTVRRDRTLEVEITGDDPQEVTAIGRAAFTGEWRDAMLLAKVAPASSSLPVAGSRNPDGGPEGRLPAEGQRQTSKAGAEMTFKFTGNQVRLIGETGPDGGLADVYLDGQMLLCGIDCWTPEPMSGVLWYRNGLEGKEHTVRIVALGKGNPVSKGSVIRLTAVQHSAATGDAGFGSGGGPTQAQRWMLGNDRRSDYVDSQGHAWKPGCEIVCRMNAKHDGVKETWYRNPRRLEVLGTTDDELYRHGMHARDFTLNFTVGPGTYHARLRFMETRITPPDQRAMNIDINGKTVIQNMDIAATAAGRSATLDWVSPNGTRVWEGLNTAVDLVVNELKPRNGIIAIRLYGTGTAEALLCAAEVGPGPGGEGHTPVEARNPAVETPRMQP